MSDQDDIDALAAEYVLGTLSPAERTAVSARRQRERDLDAAIEAWEARLAPLTEAMPSVEPSPGLLAGIEATIANGTGDTVIDLQHRVARWRRLAIVASAAAACLVVAFGVREFTRSPQPVSYVGVFQKDDQSPAFLLTVDLETRMLSIRIVSADRPADKTYQLWIASEQTGGVPQSLGLIEDPTQITRAALTSYDPAVVQRATFGVSLEPLGGSPTGRPTGPALHSKLIPAPR
jgi:anti-sigma-K factor RskA